MKAEGCRSEENMDFYLACSYLCCLIEEFYEDRREPPPSDPRKLLQLWVLKMFSGGGAERCIENIKLMYGIGFTRKSFTAYLYNELFHFPGFKLLADRLRSGSGRDGEAVL